MAEDYGKWLEELSRRTGAGVEQSDLERLNSASQSGEDIGTLQRAYTAQYERRGSNTAGSGMDTYAATRAGYGTAPDELAEEGQMRSGGGSGSGGSGSRTTSSWTGGGSGGNGASSMFPDWYRTLMERQLDMQERARTENKARADSLFADLSTRAKQTLDVDYRTDPGIRTQADAFSANQRRAQRNYLSDVAERSGPYANLQGERRMANERYGATTGAYEAGLVGSEIGARRNEIADAYRMMSGMLSGDQNRELQSSLAAMDSAQREAGLGVQMYGMDQNYDLGLRGNDLGMRNLGLNDWDRQMYWEGIQRGWF
jgi:hypothetical protein